MSSQPPIRAAGALLWRQPDQDQEPEFALIRRARYDDWTLPKGKLERHEHVLDAAVREVHEETGHRVVLGRPLSTQRYRVAGADKVVRYWSAEASASTGSFEHIANDEISELCWLSADQARARLSYAHDAKVLADFTAGPLRTVPLVVLRHAKAVKRAAWKGADDDRPLDRRGQAEAKRLISLLSAFGVDEAVSSPARRCLDTVGPFAKASELPIAEEPLFSEADHAATPDQCRRRSAALLYEAASLVVCSHRPVLPDLIAALLGGGQAMPRQLRPGGFLVLHRDLTRKRPATMAVERHRP